MSWQSYPEYKWSGYEWIGYMPSHWSTTKLKRSTSLVTSGSRGWAQHYADEGDYFVRIGNLTRDALDFDDSDVHRVQIPPGVEGSRTMTRRGDLLFSITAYLGSVAVVDDAHAGAYVSQHVALARLSGGEVDPRYAGYVALSNTGQRQLSEQAYGGTKIQLSLDDIRNLVLPLPDAAEQRLIVEFLGHEVAQVDALISKQEQLIATLREDRDAVWSKLLDDAADHAKSVKLRRAIDSIADGPFGSSLTSAHYVDEGARVIRLGNIGINEFKDADRAYISLTYARELSAHQVIAGDVVIAGLGDERMPLGRAVVIPEIGPAIVKADCFRVRPKKGLAPEFLAWALSAPQTRNQMGLLARGATRARLNTSVVGEVTIPLPPIDRQRQIIEQSRLQLAKIDALIDKSTAMIETLREFRSALITDAVTGKIDVRGVP